MRLVRVRLKLLLKVQIPSLVVRNYRVNAIGELNYRRFESLFDSSGVAFLLRDRIVI